MNDIYRISISPNQVQDVYVELIEMSKLVDDEIRVGNAAPILPTSLSTEDIIKARELAQVSSQEFGVRMTVNGVPHSLVPDGEVLQNWFRFLRFEIDDNGDGQIDEDGIREELVLVSQSSPVVEELLDDFQEVYKIYRGSVFKVTIKERGGDPGYGTAFIIDKIPSGKDARGKDLFTYRFITNAHVVDNDYYSALDGSGIKEEKGWQLTAADNNPVYKEEEVKLVGVDPVTDIGVFEVITTDDYLAFEFGDIDHVVGLEEILVIGNTLGVGVTGTPGQAKEKIIGARGYDFPYLQHDARTAGGNSGSPVIYFDKRDLDTDGNPKPKVAGVHFRGNEKISFAIPVDRVQIAYEKIIANRDRQGVTYSDWGIVLQPLSVDQRAIPGLAGGLKTGVNITKVYPGSPADQAGLKTGDILVAVDGDEDIVEIINDENYWKMARFIRDSSPDQRYRLKIYRADPSMYYEVDLKPQTRFYGRIDTYRTDAKFSVFDITPDFRELHGIPDGIQGVVFDTDDGSWNIGSLYENGIITHINGIPTPSVEIFRKMYEDLPKGKDFQITQVHSSSVYDQEHGGPGAVVRHVLTR